MMSSFILKVVVKELLPKSILEKFPDSEKYIFLVNFITKAIDSSAIYIKVPEIFIRFFLFILILIFKIVQLISMHFITVERCLNRISKIHPLIDDGMRLYIMLAAFATFEDDRVRADNRFLSIKDLTKSFKNLNIKAE